MDDVKEKVGSKYIGDIVYGANDGIITTFAVVSAVTGASLQPFIVLIIGFANLIADGFSMAAGDYLAVKSSQQYREKHVEEHRNKIKDDPDSQEDKVKTIYRNKGFTGSLLQKIVAKITGDEERWLDTIVKQEELPSASDSALKKGTVTFVAFVLAGFMPLLPFAFNIQPLFNTSIAVTFITLFTVGAGRSLITERNWFKSGLEMLFVGTLAAAVAYSIGWLMSGLGQAI